MTESDSDRYAVPGLERGLRILGEFNRSEPELTPPELARRLGVPRTTVFRLLVTLESLGFVQRTPDGRAYRLGLAVLRLGFEYLASLGMVELGRPLLDRLRDQTSYAASLVVLDRRDVVYLYRAAPRSPFTTTVSVGTRLPAHATVLGHMLLGDLPLGALRALYPEAVLDRRSTNTPGDTEALFAAVQQARERGWIVAEAFFEPHICTVAAPVHDETGHIVAAIGLTVPGNHIPADERDTLLARVREAASELSQLLNHDAQALDAKDSAPIRPVRRA